MVVSGPSGVGKTTLVDRLFQTCPLPLVRSVSATTRSPRGEEADGVDYHFVSPERFQALRDEGQFLECFEVFGRGYWYGTLWSEVRAGIQAGKWVVLNIDVHGAAAVMERFADAITIFVRPSSLEELRRRLGTPRHRYARGNRKTIATGPVRTGPGPPVSLPGRER